MQRAVPRARGFLEEVSFNLVYAGPTPYARAPGLEKHPDPGNSVMKSRPWSEVVLRPPVSSGGSGEPLPRAFSLLSPQSLPQASLPLVALAPSPLRWVEG